MQGIINAIANLICIVIFAGGAVISFAAGDMILAIFMAALTIIFPLIIWDTGRRNGNNPPPNEEARKAKSIGDTLAGMLIIAALLFIGALAAR